MNPFDLEAHLTDDHEVPVAYIDDLDADEARAVHRVEHQAPAWAPIDHDHGDMA